MDFDRYAAIPLDILPHFLKGPITAHELASTFSGTLHGEDRQLVGLTVAGRPDCKRVWVKWDHSWETEDHVSIVISSQNNGAFTSWIQVANPQSVFYSLLNLCTETPSPPNIPTTRPQIHHTAIIGPHVRIGIECVIGPYCVLGGDVEIGKGAHLGSHIVLDGVVKIGEGTHLGSHIILDGDVEIGKGTYLGSHIVLDGAVKIGEEAYLGSHIASSGNIEIGECLSLGSHVTLIGPVKIGSYVSVGHGTVIGALGFGFHEGKRIPHAGGVIVGDKASIGSQCTVDRGIVAPTMIGEETKIDNLVHIAHNVFVGKTCVIAAQTGIAGSAVVHDSCLLGGQVGIIDHAWLNPGTEVCGQSGVMSRIPTKGKRLFGSPARPMQESLRLHRFFHLMLKRNS